MWACLSVHAREEIVRRVTVPVGLGGSGGGLANQIGLAGRVLLKGGGGGGGGEGAGDPELLEAPRAPKKFFGLN